MGSDDRAPTDAELAEMKRLVREGIEQGAVGPVDRAHLRARHVRDRRRARRALLGDARDGRLLHAAPPQLRVGTRSRPTPTASRSRAAPGVPLHLAHAHLGFPVNKGRAPELLAMIDEARGARDRRHDGHLSVPRRRDLPARRTCPGWMNAGGPAATVERLRDPELRERLRRSRSRRRARTAAHGVPIDWDTAVIAGVRRPESVVLVGKTVAEAAAASGQRPIDFVCELLADEELGVSGVSHIGNEENVQLIMQHPAHMPGCDGIIVGERPHPRGWGTFPRYLARVRARARDPHAGSRRSAR